MNKILLLSAMVLVVVAFISVNCISFSQPRTAAPAQAGAIISAVNYPPPSLETTTDTRVSGREATDGKPLNYAEMTQASGNAQSQIYGTPPTPDAEGSYPYSGEVTTEAEGKVIFFYNVQRNLDNNGKYYVTMKCTNNTGETISEAFISLFHVDSNGNTSAAGGIGVNGLRPGDWRPGLGGWADPSVKVIAKVTHVKL